MSDPSNLFYGDCCVVGNYRQFLVRPLVELPDGNVLPGVSLATRGCCLNFVASECHTGWLPLLSGCSGFMIREVTEEVSKP